MRCRDHIALTLPTFLLRLTLALTFLWAGTAKIIGTTTVQGDNAARLANLAVPFIQDAQPNQQEVPETPDSPINPLPDPLPDPNQPETDQPDSDQQQEPLQSPPIIDPPIGPAVDPAVDPDPNPSANSTTNPVAFRSIALTTSPAVGSDYPDPVSIRRLYKIALLLDHAVSPTLTPESQTIPPTMPAWLGSGRMPVYAAWATAITQLAAGFFLFIGFLTRISALSLMTVMFVAMWTTQIGPAALQHTDSLLGFIPNRPDPWDPSSYSTLLWQLALIVMSLSVALLGAGPLSLDRMIFRPGRRDPYVSGESTPKPPKPPKPTPQEPQKDRTEFDRSPPPPPPQSNPTP